MSAIEACQYNIATMLWPPPKKDTTYKNDE